MGDVIGGEDGELHKRENFQESETELLKLIILSLILEEIHRDISFSSSYLTVAIVYLHYIYCL